MTKIVLSAAVCLFCSGQYVLAIGQERYVGTASSGGDWGFILAERDNLADIFVDSQDYKGVIRAAGDLKDDIARVTGRTAKIVNDLSNHGKNVVIIGTVGKSRIIDDLIKNEKIDVSPIEGKWESFVISVVTNPSEGVQNSLVIVGSDKRGTIYGIYDLSEQIGVSPWYWWADVPVEHKDALFIKAGTYIQGPPAVKYRGIFLNDEWPSLGNWATEQFGGFNHEFYVKVFELLLRLKGNFLWPAMWNSAFGDDDPLNQKLADEYGIVMSTSHHEPMMRAQKEWHRYGKGPWDYSKNEEALREFWTKGIERNNDYESIITIAMRGDGDKAMSPTTNISLLEKIVADQRKIIGDVTGKDVTTVPQVWALYKEVQDYYDKGMRVPDDVTLLLCDDNWGNVRILPKDGSPPRQGGYGMYYHFDFVGGPRNYKWLNTNQIERVWEQMHLSYQHGVDRIWIVNVGDLKPMEFPISFFLDYALNPDVWPAERLPEYVRLWAQQQFGSEHAEAIADILNKYTKYNSRRKPELLAPDTYSLMNYREAETVVADYNKLLEQAEQINKALPEKYRDVFFELVLHPVSACANLNELYLATGKNHLYAKQARAATNDLAQKVSELFAKDSEITKHYHTLAGGKWNHMMDQTHISYTNWQEPPKDVVPEVKELELPAAADMAVAIEGSEKVWSDASQQPVLPQLNVFDKKDRYIEVFNRGQKPFEFTAKASEPWIKLSRTQGAIDKELRILVSAEWGSVPMGNKSGSVLITGPDGKEVSVKVDAFNPGAPTRGSLRGFIETNGCVSIEAEHYTKKVSAEPIEWLTIPNLGRTLSGVTPVPVTAQSQTPQANSPYLEYNVYLFDTGRVKVQAYLSPVQNFNKTQGLRYAISFDDEQPQIINIHEKDTVPDWNYPMWWNQMVSDNIKIAQTTHKIDAPGEHVLKFWMVDPGIVLQKIVVDAGGVEKSYLGPPESYHGNVTSSEPATVVSCGVNSDS
jgi:hypothetical protein